MELTRKQTTTGAVELAVEVPEEQAERVARAFTAILALVGEEDDRLYAPEEVFGPKQPGRLVRGARVRENLSQKELAKRLGIGASNLSEIEHGKRPIGKEMARRLGEALNVDYRVFL